MGSKSNKSINVTTGGGDHGSPAPAGDGLEEDAPHKNPVSDSLNLIIYPYLFNFNLSFEICIIFTFPDRLSKISSLCVKNRRANFKEASRF